MPESVEYILEAEAVYSGGPKLGHFKDGLIDLTAGTAGGTACVYVGQPLDTVKVKMQTFPNLYRNSGSCFWQTFKKDGVTKGLYAGTVPALAANIAENAVLFAAYGFCQKFVAYVMGKSSSSNLNPFENALSGSLAAIFSSFALCPTELVKCRLQAMRETMGDRGKLTMGPWSLTRSIIRTDGFRGLFQGLTPTFAREVPGYFFFFGGYEISRAWMTPKEGRKDEIGLIRTAICGGVGGVSLWVLIFPSDVIKSRMQIQAATNHSMFTVGWRIFKNEGFTALYKGLGPTIIRSFFATGALFVAYEETKKFLKGVL